MTDIPDDEQILATFRQWLAETRAAARKMFPGDDRPGQFDLAQVSGRERSAGVGLYRLIEEFTALRQEVKLQSRSARGLEEQTKELLEGLRQAMDTLRSSASREVSASASPSKSLAMALCELDESLDRGRLQIEKSGGLLNDDPLDELISGIDTLQKSRPWWSQWWHQGEYLRIREQLAAAHTRSQSRQVLTALADGYGLVLQRLARAMAAEGLARIAVLGMPFDPEQMTVVEVVPTPDCTPETVVDEVRRGYLWNGRVLRFAEVRVARRHD